MTHYRYSFEFDNGLVQVLNMITKRQYEEYKEFKFELAEYETLKKKVHSLAEKDEISKKILELKEFINLVYEDNFFVVDSPMYKAIKTGYIELPDYQGGRHKVIVKQHI